MPNYCCVCRLRFSRRNTPRRQACGPYRNECLRVLSLAANNVGEFRPKELFYKFLSPHAILLPLIPSQKVSIFGVFGVNSFVAPHSRRLLSLAHSASRMNQAGVDCPNAPLNSRFFTFITIRVFAGVIGTHSDFLELHYRIWAVSNTAISSFGSREMDLIDGTCMVCGDKSAGKHYGVMACYGCKGFFRRTIRSNQSYSCRFMQKCSIDKDQRNACRFCRFQRCLNVGMEPDAIRPDRDVIGKQKNPRRKKLKREDSSLPSPGNDLHSSQQEDLLLSYLMEIEMRAQEPVSKSSELNSPIGIARVKPDPDVDLFTLFNNKYMLDDQRVPMSYEMGRTASVEQLSQAMRRYIVYAIDWIDSLFALANLSDTREKVSVLKNAFAPFCAFAQAVRTVQVCSDSNHICLCNKAVIPRLFPRHLNDTQFLANNFVARMIDELVIPMRRMMMNETEIVALSAMILLDSQCPGLSSNSSAALGGLRDRIQNALFQFIRERADQPLAVSTSRFGNLYLLLPNLAKVSSLIGENVQLAKMFGCQVIDPFLVEIFIETPVDVIPSQSTKERFDVSTQTLVLENNISPVSSVLHSSPAMNSPLNYMQQMTPQAKSSEVNDLASSVHQPGNVGFVPVPQKADSLLLSVAEDGVCAPICTSPCSQPENLNSPTIPSSTQTVQPSQTYPYNIYLPYHNQFMPPSHVSNFIGPNSANPMGSVNSVNSFMSPSSNYFDPVAASSCGTGTSDFNFKFM
ncbi:hypothetical protein L596_002853 [Steinernema carpocapsae]|uniref:Nuclear receptor domain-containing protein n=1 Tax=Steinernema carpocapsae TaxID=34508 RepID=A0A4U8UQW5_STECR|nr:hypothetical protein L596_002853 [Steinernema carpocapsae]